MTDRQSVEISSVFVCLTSLVQAVGEMSIDDGQTPDFDEWPPPAECAIIDTDTDTMTMASHIMALRRLQ